MPTDLARYYDVRPKRSGWLWMALAPDRITPIGRGEATTKPEAVQFAKDCIAKATGQPRKTTFSRPVESGPTPWWRPPAASDEAR